MTENTEQATWRERAGPGVGTKRRIPRTAIVNVVAGPDAGQQVSVGPSGVVVGSGTHCGLTLTDARVSRRHAELALVPNGLSVRDLDSLNGIMIRGTQVKDVVVPLGAVIEIGKSQLRVTAEARPQLVPSNRVSFGALAGESAVMREVFAVLEMVSPTDATVLLQGESGVGKELAAKAVHDHSRRAQGRFVVVDCTAHDQLVDSRFFGHRKGAFTGAVDDRKGAFALGDGGTIFLDEIGELRPETQAKLLRVLDSQEIQPLGSDERIRVDTRVVAATHRDLEQMVLDGTFRFDLYHRLSVVQVELPPLSDRLDDLPCLVQRFFDDRGLDPGPIAGDNLAKLRDREWPGNVRELKNVIERGFVFSGMPEPSFADLALHTPSPDRALHPGPFIDTKRPFKEAKEDWVGIFERQYIRALYREHDGNISKAARAAGLDRGHFRLLLEKHRTDDS